MDRFLDSRDSFSEMMIEEKGRTFNMDVSKGSIFEGSLNESISDSNFNPLRASFFSSQLSEIISCMRPIDTDRFMFNLQQDINKSEPFSEIELPNREILLNDLYINIPLTLIGLKKTKLTISGSIYINTIQFLSHTSEEPTDNNRIGIKLKNLVIIKSNEGTAEENSGVLFKLLNSASFDAFDCRMESSVGVGHSYIFGGSHQPAELIMKSCHLKGFSSVSSTDSSYSIIRLSSCFVEQFKASFIKSTPIQPIHIEDTHFLENSENCIEVSHTSNYNIESDRITNISIHRCTFNSNAGHACIVESENVRSNSKLKVDISDCQFSNGPAHQIRVIDNSKVISVKIQSCKFEKISNLAIEFFGLLEYSINKSEFEEIEEDCVFLQGGAGSIVGCSMKHSPCGIRILGGFKPRLTQEFSSIAGLVSSMNSCYMKHNVISCIKGPGIEVSDSLSIDVTIKGNIIQKCINGILIKDIEQDDFVESNRSKVLQFNLKRKEEADVNEFSIESKFYMVEDNVIEHNQGSGIKLEMPHVVTLIKGGKISDNKDYAVGFIGNKEKVLVIADGKDRPNIEGLVKEINFESSQSESRSGCTLI